jgi:hypothetical protein
MPLMEFIGGGDPKFMISITVLFIALLVQLVRRRQPKSGEGDIASLHKLDRQLGNLSFAILMLSALSLLLGFLHSFYFMGQVESVNPRLLYAGVSRTLITPVYGLILFTAGKLLIAMLIDKLNSVES